ncbi:MAG: PD-(D/E)XK nuclease domain-containing protein [Halanaerobiales bacterium]|nr:PD-(D/E)XK nuclease domain-containing protein [Halanaerobiales bacterium]
MTDDILQELKICYNGYLFNKDAQKRVFNSDMVLYCLTEYLISHIPPMDLIDTNISSDYSKMKNLFTLKNKERNFKILESILNDEPQLTSIIHKFSLAKEFTAGDFLSLLFYLGFLTIEKGVLNRVKLKVPNYVIKELYFDFFAQIIRDKMEQELDIMELANSIEKIALDGNIDEFVGLVERTVGDLSYRDYINFDEKYIKLLFVTYMMLSKLYYVKSEYEVKGGYIDIAFFKRMGIEDIYEGLIELKYIKKSDYDKKGVVLVQKKLEEGKSQLLAYSQVKELQEKQRLLKWVLVFVGDKCMEKVRIEIS